MMINVSLLCTGYHRGKIYIDELSDPLTKLLTVYGVHITVMLGGIFGKRLSQPSSGVRTDTLVPAGAFVVALISILAWNALILWRSAVFVFVPNAVDQKNTIED